MNKQTGVPDVIPDDGSMPPPPSAPTTLQFHDKSALKAQTLAAVAKLDLATVCRGCAGGWYDWGGDWSSGGGNWFGNSMCSMGGYCSANSARRSHNRACQRKSFAFQPQVECEAHQASGTLWKVAGKVQSKPCVYLCDDGEATMAATADGGTQYKNCDVKHKTDSVGTHALCAIDAALKGGVDFCDPGDTVDESKTDVPCGACVAKLTGECAKCKCNIKPVTLHGTAFFKDDDAKLCGAGEHACQEGSCQLATHYEVKSSSGLTLCVHRLEDWNANNS